MPNSVHRHNNPLVAGLACRHLASSIITDGHHLPPAVIQLVIQAKGVSSVYVVSDAAPVAGLPEGLYDWPAGKKVLVLSDGSVCDPENECFAGSGSTMMHCMNHLSGLGLCTLDELLQVGSFNQLKLITSGT